MTAHAMLPSHVLILPSIHAVAYEGRGRDHAHFHGGESTDGQAEPTRLRELGISW